jgi:hypothetical protein
MPSIGQASWNPCRNESFVLGSENGFVDWLVPGEGIESTLLSKLDFERNAPTFSL